MTDALLLVIVTIATANLIAAILSLRTSQRSEGLGENRLEMLRDQQERLELLREERQTLIEALEGGSQERRKSSGYVEGGRPQLVEDPKNERESQLLAKQSAERQEQEQSRLQRELVRLQESLERERLEHSENQQAAESLEEERAERVKSQRRAEQQEQERARLENELRRSQVELDRLKRAGVQEEGDILNESRPWWRRPLLAVGLLLGVLIAWFTSLLVALNLLAS